jgi:hypothetical protein
MIPISDNTSLKNNSNQRNEEDSDVDIDSGATVQSPFDRLLSRTLMQNESAQELLRSHLPAELVAHLKPETIEQNVGYRYGRGGDFAYYVRAAKTWKSPWFARGA